MDSLQCIHPWKGNTLRCRNIVRYMGVLCRKIHLVNSYADYIDVGFVRVKV